MVDAFRLENSFHHSLIICLMQNQRRLVVERKENPGICHYSTTSMHPSSSTYLVTAGWVGSFSPATLSTSSLGDRTVFPCQMRLKKIRHPFRKFWVCSGVFSQVVVLKKPQREELRRHRNQIPGPPQLAPSMQRNSGSSLSSLRMSELLALSKAEPSEPMKEAH